MSVLIATDLDRTMIYSRQALAPQDVAGAVCVEMRDGVPSAFMTAAAAAAYAALAEQAVVVPVTTRVPEQFLRVRLPGPPPAYAIASNGGRLYVDGVADPVWAKTVAEAVAESAPLTEVWAHAADVCRPEWTDKLRNADGLFCYAIVVPALLPAAFEDDLVGWAVERGWHVSRQGRKLYWVPRGLTKSAAVAEVGRRTGADRVLAAGDSLLDVDLLLHADAAIHPRHGELHDRLWSAPGVARTASSGARAGAEILEWFSTQITKYE